MLTNCGYKYKQIVNIILLCFLQAYHSTLASLCIGAAQNYECMHYGYAYNVSCVRNAAMNYNVCVTLLIICIPRAH